MSKEEQFLKRMASLLNVSESKARELFSQERKSVLRLNTLKVANPSTLLISLNSIAKLEPIPWCANAYFIVDGKYELTKSTEYAHGLFYLLNASSLIPPLVLDPKPGDVILDMCAAPGGKTLHIAELSHNKAFIYANDESSARMGIMKGLVKKHGAEVLHFMTVPAQFLTSNTKQKFDKILLDAPCSGEGLLSLNSSEPMRYWSTSKIKRLAKLQKRIILQAFDLLLPGGTLVYSTCTLAPEENEEVVQYLLENRPAAYITEINLQLPNVQKAITAWNDTNLKVDLNKAIRVIPSDYMEGFFVCKINKKTKSPSIETHS
ncbi:MAG: RsmB/NOP family class I SAM-dependent RNA methyltransferase [Patescibacteria group bacterium]